MKSLPRQSNAILGASEAVAAAALEDALTALNAAAHALRHDDLLSQRAILQKNRTAKLRRDVLAAAAEAASA